MRLSRLFASLLAVSCAPDGQSESTGVVDSSSSETTASTMSTSTTSSEESGPPGECGNGVVEPPEACDDANDVQADGCSTSCMVSGTVEWERTLEGGAGWAIATTAASEAIVVGNDLGDDIFIGAWDTAGEMLYPASLNGAGAVARALGVVIDGEGSIFPVGIDGSDGDFDGFARKVTPPETVAWTAPFGMAGADDQAHDVAFDPAGDLVVVGHGPSGAATGIDVWIARVDAGTGDVIETFPIPSDGDDAAYGVDVGPSGAIAVVGTVPGMAAGTDIAVWMVAPDGSLTWTQTYDGDDADRGEDAEFDPTTGDIVVVGTASSNIWLRRYAPDGNDMWTKTVDSGFDSEGNTDAGGGVAIDQHGNIVVTGGLASQSSRSGWTRKWSPDATEELWTVLLTGSADTPTTGRAVTIAPDGGVYAAGSEGDAVWLVRYTG